MVPWQLTPELKKHGIDACEELLRHFEAEGDDFFARVIKGDETRVHYHQPETKWVSKQGMAPFHITKTQEVPDTAICREDYADSLLGWTMHYFGTLHT